jgi:hypothetical protein
MSIPIHLALPKRMRCPYFYSKEPLRRSTAARPVNASGQGV